MKVAIIGSRNLILDISQYVSNNITEIISGGAVGIDTLVEVYADEMNIPKQVVKPEYSKYGKSAPLRRNEIIVDMSDTVIAIWDGKSRGTKYVIDYANKISKPLVIHIVSEK